ncbi:MAG: hypothetical protein VCD00_06130 [Candidatus Hydrogenedentota bacterium]
MSDDEFIKAFEAAGISRDDWTHEAHIRMGWIYCQREETCQGATDRARAGIKALNQADDIPAGFYHETVTVAFMALIWSRAQAGPKTWADFLASNRDLISTDSSALARHYSTTLLESDEARTEYVVPDLEPLPA